MNTTRELLINLFTKLNNKIEELNIERKETGTLPFAKAHVRVLGQISLLANKKYLLNFFWHILVIGMLF